MLDGQTFGTAGADVDRSRFRAYQINRPVAYNNSNEVVIFCYQSGANSASVALVNHTRTPLSNRRTKQDRGQPCASHKVNATSSRGHDKSRKCLTFSGKAKPARAG